MTILLLPPLFYTLVFLLTYVVVLFIALIYPLGEPCVYKPLSGEGI